MDKILVVEDNREVRENLIELLSGTGHKTVSATNGMEALEVAKKEHPDLILCDIMMPIMDGLEFYSEIKKLDTFANVPVIFLTAKADLEYQDRALSLGVDDYIIKPFNAAELLKRIEARLEKKKRIDKHIEELKESIMLYVPHELKSPLFPIIGYSEIILKDIDVLEKFEIHEFVKGINKAAKRLKNRIEKFSIYTKLRLELAEDKKCEKQENEEKIFSPINNKIIEKIIEPFTNREITYDLEEAIIKILDEDLNTLLFELIENAVKFSKKNTRIVIKGTSVNNKYKLSIGNSGQSFDINTIEDVLHISQKNEQSNGLGLSIVMLLRKKYDLKIYSDNNGGNKVVIEFDKIA